MRKLLNKIVSILSGKLSCPACGAKVKKFLMLNEELLREIESSLFPHSVFAFETLNVLGYSCPFCGASDRARLYKLYLERYLGDNHASQLAMLDIAPDPSLAPWLKSRPNIRYRSADISGKNVDDQLDVTQMGLYEDSRFDFILCSHVLEHVPNDLQAMKELYRVLKPGGKAIVMVPVMLTIDAVDEDVNVTSPAQRMSRFGQDDHVRLYSKEGFLERLATAGFKVHQLGAACFGADTFANCGIAQRSVLYVVEKPRAKDETVTA